MDENTIKQYAMANGISKTGKEMTQTQKLQARYGAIMQQTMKAQGDLARTMDSPTNQLRILNAQFDKAKIALGQALQPALIAVMPHLTGFATGLANVLSGAGVTTGTPFGGVVITLAEATATVRSGISSLTTETLTEIENLKTQVNTAIDGYIEASKATKTAYLNLTLKPRSNVYTRVLQIMGQLESIVGTEAAKGIQADVQTQLDAVLADGVVTPAEVQATMNLIRTKTAALIAKAKLDLGKKRADIQLKLDAGEITPEEAAALDLEAQAVYDRDVGVIEGIEAEALAELGIKDWTGKTLSVADKRKMQSALQAEVNKANDITLFARATASVLFEGTGNIGLAVDSVYAGAIEKIQGWGAEINAMITKSLEEGTDLDWAKIFELRQKIAEYTEVLAGGLTTKGTFKKSLFELDIKDPSTVSNFTKAYAATINEMVTAEQELQTSRKDLLYNLEGEELNKALKDFGYESFEQAIAEIDRLIAEAKTRITTDLFNQAYDKLAPGIDYALKNWESMSESEIKGVAMGAAALINSTMVENLDDAGKSKLGVLQGMYDMFIPILTHYAQLNSYEASDPALVDPVNRGYVSPFEQNKSGRGTGIIPQSGLEYNLTGATLVVDRPRMETTAAGLSPYATAPTSTDVNINIEPTDISVAINLDEYVLGKATIRAQQTVTKATGSNNANIGAQLQLPM